MRYWNVDESPAAPDNALNELRREGKITSVRAPNSKRTSQLWFLVGEKNGCCS